MHEASFRNTWVEISLDAIKGNVREFKKNMDSSCTFMAVVKADGYGHGALEVANAAIEAGAGYLGVALLEEAIQLRNEGITCPILVLGYVGTNSDAIIRAIENDITLTVFTKDIAENIVQIAKDIGKKVQVHIKVDSGMNRIGLRDKLEVLELVQLLKSDNVHVEGIFTHFADADNVDPTYTYKQFDHFKSVIGFLEEHGVSIPIKHCCNSAATISFPEMHMDLVRVGISLYGLYPSEHLKKDIKLTQAMSFKTKPVMIKEVEKGEPISYGCTFTPVEKSLVATIPVGYADGFSRSLSNRGNVTVKGERVPIVGRICMDQSMIDISNVQSVTKDDTFTIFGEESHGYIPLSEVAEQLDTIHYEIVCLIGKRVPRIYIESS